MELTQIAMLDAVCKWLRDALEGLKLKAPVMTSAGTDDPYAVSYRQIEVYPYYIPFDAEGDGVRQVQTHCPSVTVIPTGMSAEKDGGLDRLEYGFRLMLLTYDPGVRDEGGDIALPDMQGYAGALALSDRIMLELRASGRIGGYRISGIKARAWEQNGQVVDMRPFYRTQIELMLTAYAQDISGNRQLVE